MEEDSSNFIESVAERMTEKGGEGDGKGGREGGGGGGGGRGEEGRGEGEGGRGEDRQDPTTATALEQQGEATTSSTSEKGDATTSSTSEKVIEKDVTTSSTSEKVIEKDATTSSTSEKVIEGDATTSEKVNEGDATTSGSVAAAGTGGGGDVNGGEDDIVPVASKPSSSSSSAAASGKKQLHRDDTTGLEVKKAGMLYKRNGNVDKWNSRYLVLEGSTLIYYANETASTPRGVIDLTLARGTRDQGHTSLEWPRHLRGKGQNCFGLATTERTFYFYGRSSKDVKAWRTAIEENILEYGTPDEEWETDVPGKKWKRAVKFIFAILNFAITVTRAVLRNVNTVDPEVLDYVDAGLDAVENQLTADPDTSIGDRLAVAAEDAVAIGEVAVKQHGGEVKEGAAAISVIKDVLVDISGEKDAAGDDERN